jgi:hypothetical protein
MCLAEKGLLDLLKKECWLNGCVPSDPNELAKVIGVPLADLKAALSERVLSFFEASGTDLRSPELDNYRSMLNARREKERLGGSLGGKRSAENRRAIRAQSSKDSAEPTLQGRVQPRVKGVSKEKLSGNEKSRAESIDGWLTPDEYQELIEAFETTQSGSSIDYDRESNGW